MPLERLRITRVSRILQAPGTAPGTRPNPPHLSEMTDFQTDRTRAFGKIILFGEHFVVYKAPALVGAVSAYTDCELEFLDRPGLEVVDNRPAVPLYKEQKKEEGKKA